MTILRLFLIIITFLLSFYQVIGQGVNSKFGQNRISSKDINWTIYSTENFDFYCYDGGAELAKWLSKNANRIADELEIRMDYRYVGKVQVLIFNSPEDLNQSNIGLKDFVFNQGGYNYVIEEKIALAFNGSHSNFEHQFRAGLAELMLAEMMYGGSLQEKVQSSALLYLPNWFYKGLVAYYSGPWQTEVDDKVRVKIFSKDFRKFNLLGEDESILAGHSFWFFIANVYGEKSIPEILYITRISKGYEGAFRYVTGVSPEIIFKDWIDYLEQYYAGDLENKIQPKRSINLPQNINNKDFKDVRLNDKGNQVLFVTDDNGERKIYLSNKRGNANHLMTVGFKGISKIANSNYPLIKWNKKNIAFIYHDGKNLIYQLISAKNEIIDQIELTEFDGIQSFDYLPNSDRIILSAYKSGQSDIFIFNLKTGKIDTQITNDEFDDIDVASGDSSGNKILFSSTRGSQDHKYFDVYLLDYKNNTIENLTNTPKINEYQASRYPSNEYSFISDNNGIYNTFGAKEKFEKFSKIIVIKNDLVIDSVIIESKYTDSINLFVNKYDQDSQIRIKKENIDKKYWQIIPVTNYTWSIISRDVSLEDFTEAELIREKESFRIYIQDLDEELNDSNKIIYRPTRTRLRSGVPVLFGDPNFKAIKTFSNPSSENRIPNDSNKIEKKAVAKKDSTIYFQSEFNQRPDYYKNNLEIKSNRNNLESWAKTKGHTNNIIPEYLITQFDNSVLGTYYFPIDRSSNPFMSNILLPSVSTALSDLENNHKIKATFRMPFTLSGSDFYIDYSNLSKKIDWNLNFFRLSRRYSINERDNYQRVTVSEFSAGPIIPLSQRMAYKSDFFIRRDGRVLLSQDSSSIKTPDFSSFWTGIRQNLVYDNTRSTGNLNLLEGSRAKIFLEYYQNLSEYSGASMINIGVDYRVYIPIAKKIIWANRIAFNGSFGSAKINYLLGGVENWIGPSSTRGINSESNQPFVYQSLANNLRGFRKSARSGNKYALINSEIRIPIFSYLVNRPIRIDFFRNFTIAPFFDIGTAWINNSPFGEQPYNTRIVDQGGNTITITNINNPFLAGTGIGIRSRILGYFIRVDYSRGIEDGAFTDDPIIYFALGFDF